jgi:hypothetical protein
MRKAWRGLESLLLISAQDPSALLGTVKVDGGGLCLLATGVLTPSSPAFLFLAEERNVARSFRSGGSGKRQLSPRCEHLEQEGIWREHFN